MGKASRRKNAGEMESWFHGTDEFFTKWKTPPVDSKYKSELFPHSFISFSKDKQLALGAGKITNGFCSAQLLPNAKVLDLRTESDPSKKIWNIVRQSEFGQKHVLTETYALWKKGCATGEILRMMTVDDRVGDYYQNLIWRSSPASALSIQERQAAHVEVQNFQRRWIEHVISPGKLLGYDAVICCEIDRYREGGAKPCTNLHVFNIAVVTEPNWITRPDESCMAVELDNRRG